MDINRKTAYRTLYDIETKDAYSNLSLNENIRKFSPEDPAFVRELVYGTSENKYLLDHFLRKFITRGFNRLKPDILTILRMGVYQIVFMDSVPDYAACSETVELARKFTRGREAFVNGVLRSVSREKDKLELPDPSSFGTFIEYLSVRYSVKEWIAEELVRDMGEEGAERYLEFSLMPPELSVRVNLMKTTPEELEKELKDLGFDVKRSEISRRCLLITGSGVLDTEAFREGRFSVQDEASCLAADTLDPEPGMFVMDVCAAPGGKTAALGELMRNEGTIKAFDIHEHKLRLIDSACRRSGLTIVSCEQGDSKLPREEYSGKADRVLCDVPCSGLGVIRRKPEIKFKEEFSLGELAETQYEILREAAGYLRPGGVLVYSTCTVTDIENRGVTDRFIRSSKGFLKESERQMGPEDGTDGFYICRIIREA